MNNFVEFCVRNEIRFNISDVGYYDDENPTVDLKVIEVTLFKYCNKTEKHIRLTELRDEGLDLDDVCLDFAKDFNNFCEKVGE
jgi:hypothetical protein